MNGGLAKFIGFWLKGKKAGLLSRPQDPCLWLRPDLDFFLTLTYRAHAAPNNPHLRSDTQTTLNPGTEKLNQKNLHCFAFFYKKRRAHPMHTRRWHSRAKCRRWHTSRHTSCKRFPGWSVERRQKTLRQRQRKKDKRRQERSKEGESWQVKSWTVKVPQEHAQGQKKKVKEERKGQGVEGKERTGSC